MKKVIKDYWHIPVLLFLFWAMWYMANEIGKSEITVIGQLVSCRVLNEKVECEYLVNDNKIEKVSTTLRDVIISDTSYIKVCEIPDIILTSVELFLTEGDYKELYREGILIK